MAVRREKVVLELEDNFSSGMARAAAATKLLERELNSLSGMAVKTSRGNQSIAAVGDEAEKTGRKVEAAGRQIDRFSGRLALIAKTAAVLGPALIPIGAGAVPAIAGLTAQLGAAAGAVGVAALAFTGLGDGLDALNEYQLEPSADNLQKLRLEMERLGPAGAEFARFIDSLGPELQSLQFAAREGLFPGVEEGITHLLDLLPQVQRIVSEIAEGMGDLAADAGADLAGPQWRDFFNYLETDARPILDDLGRTIGNFAQGFASMIVAFGPLSRDFSGGLEDMSERFSEWAASLRGSDSFAEFVQYVRTAGPQVLDLLGAMADLFVGIAQAAAPIGDLVLPALTGLVRIMSALVDSPIGSVFFTAAAALSVYSAAATVATGASARLSASLAAIGGKGGGLKSAGAIAGIAVLATHVVDVISAADEATDGIDRLQDATRRVDVSQVRALRDELQAVIDKQHPAEGTLSNYVDAVKGSFNDLTGRTAEMKQAIAEANDTLRQGGGIADLFAGSIGATGEQLRLASGDARAFSGALAELGGWLDKREAFRNYRAAIDDLRDGLKKSFTPETAGQIDAVGRNIIAVASQIKDKSLRADFLQGARKSLEDLANNAGPKGQRAVEKLIGKLDELGLTRPKPKVDVDTKAATAKTQAVQRLVDKYGMTRAEARALLNDLATPGINKVRGNLTSLDGKTATTTVTNKIVTVYETRGNRGLGGGNFDNSLGGLVPQADGGSVPKTGLPYADRHPYLLADGEEVISNRNRQADMYRPVLKAINADLPRHIIKGMLAEGGTVGRLASGGTARPVMGWQGSMEWATAAQAAGYALADTFGNLADLNKRERRELEQRMKTRERVAQRELKMAEDMLSARKDELKALRDSRKAMRDQVAGNFNTDVFGDINLEQAARDGLLGSSVMQQVHAWGQSQNQAAMARGEEAQFTGSPADWIGAYLETLSPAERDAITNSARGNMLNRDTLEAERFQAALEQLRGLGLDGGAFQALAESGNLSAAQFYAGQSREQIDQFEKQFNTRGATALGLGNMAAGAQFDKSIKVAEQMRDDAREARREAAESARKAERLLSSVEKRLERIEKNAPKETGKEVGKAVNGAVGHGQKAAT